MILLQILVLSVLCVTSESVEKSSDAVVIPLKEIWAWDMPGTKPMKEGQRAGKYVSAEGAMLEEIRRYLVDRSKVGPKRSNPGFAVLGRSMDALRRARAVLVKNEKPQENFNKGDELTIVFYSFSSTWYVHLHDVEIIDRKINIRYRFVPHRTRNMSSHIALIPLNDLTAGEYDVTIKRMPLEQHFLEQGWKNRPKSADGLVCESFKFVINKD